MFWIENIFANASKAVFAFNSGSFARGSFCLLFLLASFLVTDSIAQALESSHRPVHMDGDFRTSRVMVQSTNTAVEIKSSEIILDNTGASPLHGPVTANHEVANPPVVWFQTLDRNPGRRGPLKTPRFIKTRDRLRVYIATSDIRNASGGSDGNLTNFTAGDITVTGGTGKRLSFVNSFYEDDGTTVGYHLFVLGINPTGNRDVVITVKRNSITGTNGQSGPAAAVRFTVTWDPDPPMVEIIPEKKKINNKDNVNVWFQFNENIESFGGNAYTISGGTIETGYFSFDRPGVAIKPKGGENIVVTMKANSVQDEAGNRGPPSAVTSTIVWDATAPTLSITGIPNKIKTNENLTATFTFSEEVTDFDINDVTVTGGTRSPLSEIESGKIYRLSITPNRGSNVVVTIRRNAVTDGLNRGPASAQSATATWDTAAPTVEITGIPAKINSTTNLTATFTFNEAVTGFDSNDVTVTNGDKGTFTATSATEYTLVITPEDSKNLIVTVAANSATDGLNTGPASAESATATWDGIVPTLSITGIPDKINATNELTATLTFSEAVTGFTTDDITVTGGTKKDNGFSGSGASYTLVVIPTRGSNLTVTVRQDAATDGVNTSPATAQSATAVWDNAAPTVTISGIPTRINSTDDLTATFTFNEAVTGFDSNDVSVTNGTAGTFAASSATVYTLVITPESSKDLTVSVAANSATDGLNTGPAIIKSVVSIWDDIAPTVTITGLPEWIDKTDDLTAKFTFSEVVTGFGTDDITVTGGTKKTFTAINSKEYTLIVTPEGNKNVEVIVNADAATDGPNRGPTSAVTAIAVWNPPITVDITGLPAKANKALTPTVIFTFNPSVTDFNLDDIMVTGGKTIGNLTGSGTFYAIRIEADGDEDLVVTVRKDAVTDGFKRGPTSAQSITSTWDVMAPSVSIEVPTKINSRDPLQAIFTFDESVRGFTIDDVEVTGGKKGLWLRDGSKYSVIIVPDGEKDVVVTVPKDAATDGINKGPEADVSATAKWDATAPTLAIGVPDKINKTDEITATFTFSEDVMDFDIDDVAVTNGDKGTFTATSATEYRLIITPEDGSDVVVTVAADAATDGTNTGPASAESVTATWDTAAPTVEITGIPAKINSTTNLTATLTFNEAVTGFDSNDVTVTNGEKGTFTSSSATVYTLVITPESSKDLTVSVAANSATDGLNMGPASAESVTAVWDGDAPTVTITGIPGKINTTGELTATLTFSESVTGFTTDDITVTGGTKKDNGFSGSGASYTLVVIPTRGSDVVVTVAADAATDGTNTGPASAESVTATWDTAAPTVEITGIPAKINSTTNLTATLTFNEAVTGFDSNDVTVTNGEKGTFTSSSATVYTLVITPESSKDLTVSVAANSATDGLNMGPASAESVTAVWDGDAPTVTITGIPGKINTTGELTATLTFSESVTGFTTDDITVTGGTKKDNGFSGSGASYTLVVIPTRGSDVVVTVAADAATDGTNTGPASAESVTATWDTAAPTVEITGIPAKINSTTNLTATLTFNEAVTGFDSNDVTVTNGEKGTFTSSSATVYTLVITPESSKDLTVSVAANSATDGLNMGPASAESVTAVWDGDAPTVTITGIPGKINTTGELTATLTFSESVTGFTTDDITVTGGTKKDNGFSGSGASYTLVVIPTRGSDVVVTVAADAATDGTNTGPASAESVTATWDTAAPTVEITGIPAKINSTTNLTATLTFNEAVTGFDSNDVTVTNGEKGTFTSSSATVYTLVITPESSKDLTVSVAANSATDGLNMGPASAESVTAVWDGDAPTVTITGIPGKINTTGELTATLTFSESVTGFTTDDITVTGGTKKDNGFSGSGASYTLVVIPTRGSDVVVTVAADAATDGTNTGPASAESVTATWDTAAPTVEITGIPAKINSTTNLTATLTFNEAVTGFDSNDVTVTNGEKGTFTSSSATVYTLVITPESSKDLTVSVAANSATDGLNMGPASAESVTAVWDGDAPTVTITGIPGKINTTGELTATLTFSESVTGFTTDDITVTGGTKKDNGFSGSGASYTLVVIPTRGSDVVVTVAADAATDGTNTGPASAESVTATWDTAAPTVEITGIPAKINSTTNLTATLTFNEAVTGFDSNDVTVTNGEKGTFTSSSATVYTLVITPESSKDLTVSVAANSATDGLNMGPASAESVTAVWDGDAPTVTITGIPGKINTTGELTATLTFSESVTGFTTDDITVTGGTKKDNGFSGSGASYTLVVIPTRGSDVVVTVAADAATDGTNTGPASAESVTATWDTAAPTVEITGIPAKINSTTNLTATLTFNEAVTGFDSNDVTVTNGEKGTFTSSSATVYTLVITPESSKDLTVSVAANSATDGLNMGPASAESVTAVWDGDAPTVTITGIPGKINTTGELTATLTFSESVTGFTTDDITVTGGTKKDNGFSGSGASYTLVVIPTRGSDVVVTVAADAATDGTNTGPASAESVTATWDTAAPTVEITGIPAKINSTTNLTATLTFNEAVTGFDSNDVTVTNGEKGTFTSSSATVYTLVITPESSKDLTVSVAANSATDGLNMGPASAESVTAVWDGDAPTVTITGIPGKINTTGELTATLTFSESVTGFTTDDITVTGGTKKDNGFSGSGASYTLVVIPTRGSDVVVTVAADAATDGTNTGPASAESVTATWDTAAPTVEITGIPAKINSTTNLTATLTFNEAVTGFDSNDVTVTNGEKGTFTSSSATVYTLVITPESSKDLTVSVAANSATDGLNMGPASAESVTAVWDGDAPTVTITGIPGKINTTGELTATLTFSESVTGFTTDDITVTGGTKKDNGFSGSGASYTLVVIPTRGSDVVVTVAADAATDGTNTGPASAESVTATWDTAAPTVEITGIPAKINSTTNLTATLTFNEAVTGFDSNDVTVTNGEKGTFTSSSATVYTLVITPESSKDLTVSVAANSATDGLNMGPASAESVTAVWDGDAPTVTITGIPGKINTTGELTATLTFSESVTGFTTDDITVTGGTKKDNGFSGSGASYTLVVIPTRGSDVVVTVAADAATDGTNTGPASAESVTATWDTAAPTVEITGIPAKINSTTNLTATLTFNEAVTGFDSNDVTVTNGEKGTFTSSSATVYTLVITPESSKDLTVSVAANSATDGLNMGPASAESVTAVWDGDAPTVTITGIPGKINTTGELTATLTFSESVTGFTTDDITVTGGTKKDNGFSGSGASYTLVVIPTRGSDVVVTVAADAATDGTNTGPASAESVTATWDTAAPTVEITGIPAKINSTTNLTATLTFNEAVTGFDSNDVTVTNGEKGTFTSSSATVYTLVITPESSKDLTVSVAANSATDGLNMGPASAESVTAVWDGDAPTLSGAPTGLTAEADGATAIDLNWIAPVETGGVPISGYKIEVSPNGINNWTVLVASHSTTS